MPDAAIIPVLAYADVDAAVTWLARAFGFVERLRIGDHRAQLTFGAGAIVVTRGEPAAGPERNHSVMVRIDDADAHHLRARDAGATIVQPPTNFRYGERQYSALDLGGHAWTFSQSIADVDPATWGGLLR